MSASPAPSRSSGSSGQGVLRLRGRTWWRVRSKLAVVVAIPAAAFTALAGLQIAAAAADGTALSSFADRSALARPVSAVVTALQNERDRTAGELAGAVHDDQFDAAVAGVQKETDDAYARLAGVAGPDRPGFAAVASRFDRLPDTRAAARTAALPAEVILDFYGDTIADLFAMLPAPATAPQPRLFAPAIAVMEVARAKEHASQLRARLYAACRARFAEPATYYAFAESAAEQRAALVRFRANAAALAAAVLGDARAVRANDAVTDLRDQILDQIRERSVTVQPERWWETSTAALTVLGEAEALAVDAVVDESAAEAHAQRTRTLWLTVLILAVLVVALGSWLIIGRSMVRSLRDLRVQALDVAQRRLPEAIERLRAAERAADIDNLPTTAFPQLGGDRSRNDEIGEVGDAFAAVHASAVQLAGEQAELRRGANAMIVNVARRSQMLVERQLKLLDEVQSAEDDPDLLANLFRLDHLLTRMRRNDENLLVLAGADTSRRRPDPVPLSAVVLAAMAEIDEYERVVSDVDDGGYIAGPAVADVVHIVAELLENATSFSPPDATVLVVGRVAPDGRSATVRIADRGLGMSEKKLAEANQRLDRTGSGDPAQVASATAQMGLWVVGRLAARHGISVRLRALNTGIQAEISIPAPLLAPAPARPYADLARSVLRSSMTHLLGRELPAGAQVERRNAGPDTGRAAGPDTGRAAGPDTGRAAGPDTGRAAGPDTGRVAGGDAAGRAAGGLDAVGRDSDPAAATTVPNRSPAARPTPDQSDGTLPRRVAGALGLGSGPVAAQAVAAAGANGASEQVPPDDRDTPPMGSVPLPRPAAESATESEVESAAFSYLTQARPAEPDPDIANLDGWTRPIRLPAQGGRRAAGEGHRSRRERPHTNAAPVAASSPVRPVARPSAVTTSPARPSGAMVPAPADGGTSRAGLPVRVPMAQLPRNPLASPPAAATGDTPDESDPADVSAALNRFYRARHRASSDDTLS